MYTCIHRVYMWEVQPTLYWRLKVDGKWTWRKAEILRWCSIDEVWEVIPPKFETKLTEDKLTEERVESE